MAAVLEFRCDPDRVRRKAHSLHDSASCPVPDGEVVIFPGIRVERDPNEPRPHPQGSVETFDHEI